MKIFQLSALLLISLFFINTAQAQIPTTETKNTLNITGHGVIDLEPIRLP